jgi:putative NIF3 family GTP cyclohydrolase 1 type 2
MTPEQRETLEALLAENDALRRAASDAQDLFAVCDGERLVLREQVDALTAEVADLRTRAIPADYSTRVIVDMRERGLACVLYRHDAAPDARWTTSLWAHSPSDKHHPTLADALDAAGKETP